jgi:acyl carrier protein
LTPNGKIDRRALPDVAAAHGADDRPHDPPRTPVEVEVADILCQVLGRGRVGRSESFFNLGGHSLSAVQVAYRIRRHFSIDFPLQTLLQAPTVAELAVRVEDMLIGQADGDELNALLDEIGAAPDPQGGVEVDRAAPPLAAAR